MCSEKDSGAPQSRLQGIVEAIRFVEFVVGVPDLSEILLSRRCLGAARKSDLGPKRQAEPFRVSELQIFHAVLNDVAADPWDRLFAGSLLLAIYTRSRWADMQHSDSMTLDPPSWPSYIELKISHHKTKHANSWLGGLLCAVAPSVGIEEGNWVYTYVNLRLQLGVSLEDGFPIMPAPDQSGMPTRRPLSTAEVRKWIAVLLGDTTERKLTSHSCKCTMLSYLAKHGCDVNDRAILGGHSSHISSVIRYSRDSLAAPLRSMEKMLADVRSGRFLPDANRSGRFVETMVEEVTKEEPIEVSDGETSWTDVGPLSGNLSEEFPLDLEGSGDESGNSSSSSDEEATEGSNAARLVNAPRAPMGTHLLQHAQSKMLHLMLDENQNVFLCGRPANEKYAPPVLLRWDTACCSRCWRASGNPLVSRIGSWAKNIYCGGVEEKSLFRSATLSNSCDKKLSAFFNWFLGFPKIHHNFGIFGFPKIHHNFGIFGFQKFTTICGQCGNITRLPALRSNITGFWGFSDSQKFTTILGFSDSKKNSPQFVGSAETLPAYLLCAQGSLDSGVSRIPKNSPQFWDFRIPKNSPQFWDFRIPKNSPQFVGSAETLPAYLLCAQGSSWSENLVNAKADKTKRTFEKDTFVRKTERHIFWIHERHLFLKKQERHIYL